jgi:hypothetical protein
MVIQQPAGRDNEVGYKHGNTLGLMDASRRHDACHNDMTAGKRHDGWHGTTVSRLRHHVGTVLRIDMFLRR